MNYTMRNLAEEILREYNTPLSHKEIWRIAVEKGLDKKVNIGKTAPELNLYNTINGDIRNNDNSIFKKVSKNPALFTMREAQITEQQIEDRIVEVENNEEFEENAIAQGQGGKPTFNEAALHAVLAMYIFKDDHFKCRVKTINHHESSKKRKPSRDGDKLKEDWYYPDLIGVYFPFSEYSEQTRDISRIMNSPLFKIFSFEMKLVLKKSELRSCYFQAVSNSSWANEGYLVAAYIDWNDPELKKELTLLSNSFGIGVIKLNLEEPKDSEILIPARVKSFLDIDTLENNLMANNPGVEELFNAVILSEKNNRILDADAFDKVYDDSEYQRIINEKGPMALVSRKK
ncbi:MAG: HrgA protein [bacterium]|nr:HrgA protein [bacterium]